MSLAATFDQMRQQQQQANQQNPNQQIITNQQLGLQFGGGVQTANARCFNNGNLNNSSGLTTCGGISGFSGSSQRMISEDISNGQLTGGSTGGLSTSRNSRAPLGCGLPRVPESDEAPVTNTHGITRYENFNIKGSYLWEGDGHMFCIHSELGQGVIMRSATHPHTGRVICQVQFSSGDVLEVEAAELALHDKHKVQTFQEFMRSCAEDSCSTSGGSRLSRAEDSLDLIKRRVHAVKRSSSGASLVSRSGSSFSCASGSEAESESEARGTRWSSGAVVNGISGTLSMEGDGRVQFTGFNAFNNSPRCVQRSNANGSPPGCNSSASLNNSGFNGIGATCVLAANNTGFNGCATNNSTSTNPSNNSSSTQVGFNQAGFHQASQFSNANSVNSGVNSGAMGGGMNINVPDMNGLNNGTTCSNPGFGNPSFNFAPGVAPVQPSGFGG